jgi:hypothetical protein
MDLADRRKVEKLSSNVRFCRVGRAPAEARSSTSRPLEDRRASCAGVSQKHACSNGIRLRDSLPWPSE